MNRPLFDVEVPLAKYAMDHGGWRVATTISLRGPRISENDLSHTLKRAQQRHPVLRSRIQRSGQGEFSYSEDSELLIPVKIYSKMSKEKAYSEASKESLNPGDGVFRVCIVPDFDWLPGVDDDDRENPQGTTSLIFLCEHFACDGMSFLPLVHEILLGLANTISVQDVTSLSEPPDLVSSGKKIRGSRIADIIKLGKIALSAIYTELTTKNVPINTFSDSKLKRNELTTRSTQVCLTETISQTETRGLLNHCREYKTTMTGAITSVITDSIAGFIQEQQHNSKPQTVSTSLAIDARRHYTPPMENEHLSFHVTSVLPYPLKATGSGDLDEMWKNAKLLKDHITSKMKRGEHKTLMCRAPVFLNALYNMKYINSTGQVFFTNWGVAPFDTTYNKWEVVEVSPGINTLCLPFPVVIALTVDKELQLTLLGSDPTTRKEHIHQILDGAMARLKALS